MECVQHGRGVFEFVVDRGLVSRERVQRRGGCQMVCVRGGAPN
jgi:hypothetical protein